MIPSTKRRSLACCPGHCWTRFLRDDYSIIALARDEGKQEKPTNYSISTLFQLFLIGFNTRLIFRQLRHELFQRGANGGHVIVHGRIFRRKHAWRSPFAWFPVTVDIAPDVNNRNEPAAFRIVANAPFHPHPWREPVQHK